MVNTPHHYVILGIDPGQRGALVWLRGADPVRVERMPAAPKVGVDIGALATLLRDVVAHHVVVERAQTMPGQGSSSMGRYMRDYGSILGILAALRIPHETVHPSTWHRQLVGAVSGDPKAEALRVVRQRLPTLELTPPRHRVPHDGIVDAACLALWGQLRLGLARHAS